MTTTHAKVDLDKPHTIETILIENSSDDKIAYDLDIKNKGILVIKFQSKGKK